MNNLISASYNDAISVSFRSDAWFNATQVSSCFGKTPKDWLRTEDTKAYMQAIGQICLIDEKQLVSKKAGNPDNGGGTWMHPKLGIPFARWLDPKFGVWCDMQIEKILHPIPNALKSLEPPTLTASEQQTLSEIVDLRTKDHGPAIGKAKAVVWSRVHRKFRVARYQQLPREQLADAIAYVMQMVIKTPAGEVPALPAPEPIVSRYHYPMTLWNPQNRMGKTAWLTYPEYTRPEPSTRPLMRLLTQLQQEGHEVAGARAEYDTIRHLLEVFYYRLDMLRTLFERMDSHGLNIQLH